MKIYKILENLISFNTVNDKENQQIMNWLGQFLVAHNFKIEYIKDKKTNRLCLLGVIGKKPMLSFVGHTDVVPVGNAWSIEPFQMKIVNDKIYGLGSCDMKGGMAAFLSAITEINQNKLNSGINVLFTYGEEKDFSGIKYFLEQKKLNSKYIIIGEPTGNIPFIASKGIASFKIIFNGKSVHASIPGKGVNAIIMASKFINELLQESKNLEKVKNKIFTPENISFNIAKINGGDAINKVPALCEVEIECRTVENGQEKIVTKLMKKIAKKYNANAKINFSLPPFLNSNEKFIKEVEKISNKKRKSSSFATEAQFIKSDCNIVILGPGPFNAHKPNEWVSKKQLLETQKIYLKFIKKYCY